MLVGTAFQFTHTRVLHTDEHQAWQRLHDVAQVSAASNPISSRAEGGEGESGYSDTQSTTNVTTIVSSSGGDEEKKDEEPVIQSAVMLRFGAEVPSSVAAGKCGRTAQFPIPHDWNDPEVRVRNRTSKGERTLVYLPRVSLNPRHLLAFILLSELKRLFSAPVN